MSTVAPVPAGRPAPPAAPGSARSTGSTTAADPTGLPAPGRDMVVDTPGLLNRWQLIGMSVAVVFAVVSALLQVLGWQADGRAADDTEQLIRVQNIQSSLLRADALATNAFLVGGLEDPAQRAEYERTVDDVQRLIADAAQAQPADEKVLAALNVEVGDYTTAVAQARDNNRQLFPVGAEYLSDASTSLRTEATPLLAALVKANTARADDSMAGQHPWWLLLVGAVAVAGLVWINQQLARTFRRRINVGVAVAAGLVAVTTLVAAASAFVNDSSNDQLRRGDLAVATAQAQARTAANDAKASESLRLIRRGSGAAFEEQWKASAATVQRTLQRGTADSWRAYREAHRRIVQADDAGDWEGAVKLATGTADTGSTATFDRFDEESAQLVGASGAVVTAELRSGREVALGLSLLTLLLGAVAAAAVARGIAQRRGEFA
ncbi:hypothetical protein [Nocardioides sp.]|uniref:hypothetical protein n=1 Tax=Nocardioides sp. TaxID=35761 RepID=UPI003513D32B